MYICCKKDLTKVSFDLKYEMSCNHNNNEECLGSLICSECDEFV